MLGAPSAVAPTCVFGFSTVQSLNWLLKCRKTVPTAQLGTAVTQAQNANCNTSNYWNYGPNVTTAIDGGNATVEYLCGHVEG